MIIDNYAGGSAGEGNLPGGPGGGVYVNVNHANETVDSEFAKPTIIDTAISGSQDNTKIAPFALAV